VVWRLDRLGRSLGHLIETVRVLDVRGIGFKSIHESIDTTTSAGRLVFHIFGALAECERALIVDRTKAGLAAARERGAKPGRRPLLSAKQVEAVKTMHAGGRRFLKFQRSLAASAAPRSTGRWPGPRWHASCQADRDTRNARAWSLSTVMFVP
jgi:DNA invertase Pin-like site-specific DNA recombinase